MRSLLPLFFKADFMANVAPPRFVRTPGPAGGDDLAPALREAFDKRQDRLPLWIEQLLSRLRARR